MQSFIKKIYRRTTRKLSKCLNNNKSENNRSAVPAALMHAAKNQLPPVQFHHVHGANVRLSNNKFVARRVDSFCQGLVFSNRVILPNERVYIKLIKVADRQNGLPQWSGTIRFGFTSVDPATLRYKMPKYACPDMTSQKTTWAKALSDKVVHENIVIHFSYDNSGRIHYGINNQDCGIFHANVTTTKHLWFILDIYGNTTGVELIDPRLHSNSGLNSAHPRIKSEDFQIEATLSPASGRRRSSQNNSTNQRTATTMADITPNPPPEHLMSLAALDRTIANQNIYSPPPMHINRQVIPTTYSNYQQPRTVRSSTSLHRYLHAPTNNTPHNNQALQTHMSKLRKNSSNGNSKRQQSKISSTTSTTVKNETSKKKAASSTPEAPATRDCPICYERPINCVLYQCGHMCTCYECGVKQWRTQSRTCPICRTVIKDVIKTFMS